MACKGTCERYRARTPRSLGFYKNGYKRCGVCELHIKWDGLFCPCCSNKLRIGPRRRKFKDKLKIHNRI